MSDNKNTESFERLFPEHCETLEQAQEKAMHTPMSAEVFETFAELSRILGSEITEFRITVNCRIIDWWCGVALIIDDDGEPNILLKPSLRIEQHNAIVAKCQELNVNWEIFSKEDEK